MMNPEAELRRMRRLQQQKLASSTPQQDESRHKQSFLPMLTSSIPSLASSNTPRELSLCPVATSLSSNPTSSQSKSNDVAENNLEESREEIKRVNDEEDSTRPFKKPRLAWDCDTSQPGSTIPLNGGGSRDKGILSDFSSNSATPTVQTHLNNVSYSPSSAKHHSSTATEHSSTVQTNQLSSAAKPESSDLASTALALPIRYMRYPFPVQSLSPAHVVGIAKSSVPVSVAVEIDQDMELGGDDELMYPPSPADLSNGTMNEKKNETTRLPEPRDIEVDSETRRETDSDSQSDSDFEDPGSDTGSDDSNYKESVSSRVQRHPARNHRRSGGDVSRGKDILGEQPKPDQEGENPEAEACHYRVVDGAYHCLVPHCKSAPASDRSNARRHARNSHGLGAPPDVRCPIRPCPGRFENRASCKRHVQARHRGKWDDSVILQHVVPSAPYKEGHQAPLQNNPEGQSIEEQAVIRGDRTESPSVKTKARLDDSDDEAESESEDEAHSEFEDDREHNLEDKPEALDEAEEQIKRCYRRSSNGIYHCTVPRCKGGPFRDSYNARKHARNVHGLGGDPDVRCPIFPCKARLIDKEACKRHVKKRHPGKWKNSLILKYVIPPDPYVRSTQSQRPASSSQKKAHTAPAQKMGSWQKALAATPKSRELYALPIPKTRAGLHIPRRNALSTGNLPVPRPTTLSPAMMFPAPRPKAVPAPRLKAFPVPRSDILPLPTRLPPPLPVPKPLPSNRGVTLEARLGILQRLKESHSSSQRGLDSSSEQTSTSNLSQ